ncbi:hypothetical protein ANANG_G00311080 [Anguilla anguilla]|uniref:Uncharacterized protein n=1 Tax=Anguilla anguilla TaxID=7936 RepID=A0A9D3LI96_ANGAN|nr:hypothetical protein ANANG_G00311080 [Anguilla anguilla]
MRKASLRLCAREGRPPLRVRRAARVRRVWIFAFIRSRIPGVGLRPSRSSEPPVYGRGGTGAVPTRPKARARLPRRNPPVGESIEVDPAANTKCHWGS